MDKKNEKSGLSARSFLSSRLLTVIEVTVVFMLGIWIAQLLRRAFHLDSFFAQMGPELSSTKPDFLKLAWIVGSNLIAQYIGLFIPVVLLIVLRRGKLRLGDFGLTVASQKWSRHVIVGIGLFAVGALPLKVFLLADKILPLGPGSELWGFLKTEWNLEFWILMAVGSYVLVPFVEELFFRGYLQARLAESFDGVAAILLSSVFFTFLHSMYHKLSILSIGTILFLIFFSVSTGYVYFRTRSLIGPMVAHALIDIPYKGAFDFIVPVLMVALVAFFSKETLLYGREFLKDLSSMKPKWAVGLGLLYFALAAVLLTRIFEIL